MLLVLLVSVVVVVAVVCVLVVVPRRSLHPLFGMTTVQDFIVAFTSDENLEVVVAELPPWVDFDDLSCSRFCVFISLSCWVLWKCFQVGFQGPWVAFSLGPRCDNLCLSPLTYARAGSGLV